MVGMGNRCHKLANSRLENLNKVNFQTLTCKLRAKNNLAGASCLNQDVRLTGMY